jgi:hypothetical protein
MSIPGGANPLLLTSAAGGGPGGYLIERSVRFNSSDSAYLERTPSTAGNRKTWTWAGWVKRSKLGDTQSLFCAGTYLNVTSIRFDVSDKLTVQNLVSNSAITQLDTTQVFRDVGAWYHIAVAVDTTQATAASRFRVYLNGSEITTFSTATYQSQNTDTFVNSTDAHQIGSLNWTSVIQYFNGYAADYFLIDGQALDPTSFGKFDDNGIWQPIAYSGSYGTNGFHLPFSDNSTAAALGTDTSGAGNNWTVNNISVAAGAGNDSLVDVPTNGTETDTGVGGEVRGNYCTLNPLNYGGAINAPANGNLDVSSGTLYGTAYCTIGVSSGKWYWEFTNTSTGASGSCVGVSAAGATLSSDAGAYSKGYIYTSGALKANNNSYTSYGDSWNTSGVVIGVAYDADTGTLTFYKNGTSQGQAFSGIASTTEPYFPVYADASGSNSGSGFFNFGQRPFAYTAPSGFKALNTANLPAPVVTKPSEYMDVKLYTGNGSTQTISGLEFSPDLVWIKERNAAADHALYDAVRGATYQLESNTTTDETTEATGLTAFNSDGFALGALAQVNTNTDTYVAWAWEESVSAGFDIVTYTGNGSARTIAHGLGVAPSLIIVKARTTASTDQGWAVYHASNTANPETDYLLLNSTAATADLDTVWNDTAPTSSVFSVGTNALVNANNDTYVAYCWAPADGYSNGFSYTGNGSTDGSFVYLGFRPRLILLKCSSTTGNWTLVDTAREGYNVDNDPLYPNLSNAEGTTDLLDITSNGFKLRTTDASVNSNAATYVGFAWAESPFQYARAR